MYAKFFKRFIDFWLSLLALIVFTPLLLILSIIGVIAMRGNPLFVQKRPGKKDKNGEERIFSLIKFRTMSNKKDENGKLLPDEARLSGYGKFLRKTSLDELPELVNILIGNMAIVGPRPLLVKYLPLYTDKQRNRHNVRPGLTGLAQIHGRNSIAWEEKFTLDLEYINKITFSGDLKIIIGTVKKVFEKEGISSETAATMEEFEGSEKCSEEGEICRTDN